MGQAFTLLIQPTPPLPTKEAAPFRFLDLPPEIRHQIYEYTIGTPTIDLYLEASPTSHVLRSTNHLHAVLDTKKLWIRGWNLAPIIPLSGGLLRTCKLINREATDLWYARTTFVVRTRVTRYDGCTLPAPRDWRKGRLPVNGSIPDETMRNIRHAIFNITLAFPERENQLAVQGLAPVLAKFEGLETMGFEMFASDNCSAQEWPAELRRICRGKKLKQAVDIAVTQATWVPVPVGNEGLWEDVKWQRTDKVKASTTRPVQDGYLAWSGVLACTECLSDTDEEVMQCPGKTGFVTCGAKTENRYGLWGADRDEW